MDRWRSAARALATMMVYMCAFAGVGGSILSTAAAASLPDGRAYELVSPTDKNGADILAESGRTRAAADGNAVQFSSLGGFADVLGTGVASDYLALRSSDPDPGTNGWSTHAITPPQAPLSVNGVLNADPLYVGDFSADLDRGVFRAWSPVTDVPAVARTANLYVRSDLRRPGIGSYQLVSSCPLCAVAGPLPPLTDSNHAPWYAGASSDFTHVVFESRMDLTTDVPVQPGPRVYEWDAGQLRFAGYIPPGSATSCGGSGPACVAADASIPGLGVGTVNPPSRPANVISRDGARIFFTVGTDGSGTVDGSSVLGRIYMRTAHTTTDEITASERTDCADDPACGVNGIPDPAPTGYRASKYAGASLDGSRAFFTTAGALTDDARDDGQTKLYMYDTTKPASDARNLTLINVDREPGRQSPTTSALS